MPKRRCLDCPAIISGGGKKRCQPCSDANAEKTKKIYYEKKRLRKQKKIL